MARGRISPAGLLTGPRCSRGLTVRTRVRHRRRIFSEYGQPVAIGNENTFSVRWGDPRRKVPQTGTMTKDQMEDNYYGFVAVK